MARLVPAGVEWTGPSADPNDEQFGDVVRPVALEDATGGAVLVGEPFDRGVVGRPGAAAGPRALREALAGLKTHHFAGGPVANVADGGDVAVGTVRSVADLQAAVAAVTRRIHAAGALPAFLGGDNSLTYPNVRPLLEESVGVVTFDAHLDVRAVGDDPTSGTPYRQLLEAGLDAYACVGARSFETTTAYADYLDERGGTVVTARAAADDPEGTLDRVRDAMAGVDRVYLSVDLDVLDAAAAPGVSAPTPGGLAARELFWLVRSLAGDDRLAGVEVVECAPPHDVAGRTSAAGARVLAHALSGAQSSAPTDHDP